MTTDLGHLLAANPRSGVYRLGGRAGVRQLARIVEDAGWRFLYLDAGKVHEKHHFLAAMAGVLQFPEWAGHNWDAFEELLNDLSWLPPVQGYVLVLDRLGDFSRRHPGDMQIAVDILATALSNRPPAAEPALLVLLRGARAAARTLPPFMAEPVERAGKIAE